MEGTLAVPRDEEPSVEQPDLAPRFVSEFWLCPTRAARLTAALPRRPKRHYSGLKTNSRRVRSNLARALLWLRRACSQRSLRGKIVGLGDTEILERSRALNARLHAIGRDAERAKNLAGPEKRVPQFAGPLARFLLLNRPKICFLELLAESAYLSGGVGEQTRRGPSSGGDRRSMFDMRCERVLNQVLFWIRQEKVWWVHLAPPQTRRHALITARVLQTCALIGDISVTVANEACAKCWTSENLNNC